MKDLLQRRTWRMDGEIDHQQGDGDSEHAVAESLHPALAQRPAPARVVTSGHASVSSHQRDLAAGEARDDERALRPHAEHQHRQRGPFRAA